MTAGKRIFTFDEVQQEVKGGRWLLIYERQVYDVGKWKDKHPGGDLIIQHMLGRDATDQILTNHSAEVVAKYMGKMFIVGDLVDEKNRSIKFDRPLSMEFRQLHRKITEEGLFEERPLFFVLLAVGIISLWLASIWILMNFGNSLTGVTAAAIVLAFAWQNAVGFMHDGGHNSITHHRWTDYIITCLFTNCFTGASGGFWKAEHYLHHLVTNDPEHDPQAQVLPLIALTARSFNSLWSTFHKREMTYDQMCKLVIPLQHMYYVPLMSFFRFVMYRESVLWLLKQKGWKAKIELASMGVYWAYLAWMISLIPDARFQVYFFVLSHMLMVFFYLLFFASHWSMSMDPMGAEEDFVTYQARTTIDFYWPQWLDWAPVGLQFQIAHHLFPRITQPHLRKANEHVMAFLKKHNIKYNIMDYVSLNADVCRALKEVAEEANLLAEKTSKAN